MALVYIYIFFFVVASVHSFFLHTFKKSGIDKLPEGSMIPACPSLMCFFLTGAIPKGLILQKICV